MCKVEIDLTEREIKIMKSKKENTQIKIEGLTITQVIQALQGIKKGIYHSFTKKHTESNGYYYLKTYVGRLASYSVISGKETTEIKKINGRQVIIPNVLYYYQSTGNYLLMVATTKKKSHHSKTTYFDNNGNEISKEQYEMVNPPKKSSPFNSPVFNIKVSELVMIK